MGFAAVRRRLRPYLDTTIVRFAAMTFVAVALVGTLLGVQLADDRRQAGLEAAHARAVPTAAMLRHELMQAAGPTSMTAADIEARFDRHIGPAGVSDVNVWSANATLLFSTARQGRENIDIHEPAKTDDLRRVIDARVPTSEVVRLEEAGSDHHLLRGTVFRTYSPVPMGDQDGGTVVVEILQDYAPTEAAIASGLRRLAATLVAALAVLYLLLLPIALRMNRQLRGLLDRERKTVRQLEEADATKNLFLQAISHELRTPLTLVSGVASTLQRHDRRLDRNKRARLLDRLVANSSRLETLLTDLLDIDRLGRGVVDANRRSVRIPELVGRTLSPLGGGSQMTVDVQVSTANVDPAQVERILENLVVNAQKYAGPRARIWVRARAVDGHLLLAVDDDGPGVPDDVKKQIFEPFERGAVERPHAPGTGIGLALVARFARLHGGRAWVQDRPGGGGSFRVLLADAGAVPRTSPRRPPQNTDETHPGGRSGDLDRPGRPLPRRTKRDRYSQ